MLPKLLTEADGKVLFAHYNDENKLTASGLIYSDFDLVVTLKLFGELAQ